MGKDNLETEGDQPSEAKPRKGYVEYTGTSHYRHFTKSDWAACGVEHDTITFMRDAPANRVPLSAFDGIPQDVFQRAIVGDRDFRVVEGD